MKINFIRYTKSVIGTDGSNEKFEASATLDKNESPDVAFHDLKSYVHEKLGLKAWQTSEFKNTPRIENEVRNG